MLKENTDMLASSRNTQKEVTGIRSSAGQLSDRLNKFTRSRTSFINSAEKNKTFYTVKPAGKPSRVDSIAYAISIRIWNDTIKKEQKRIQKLYKQIDSLYGFAYNRFTLYSGKLKNIVALDNAIIQERQNEFDDLDYEVRRPEDTLIRRKHKNDSLLIFKKDVVFNPLFIKYGAAEDCSNKLMNAYKTKIQMLQQLKSFCADGTNVELQYKQTLADMSDEVASINKHDGLYQGIFNKLYKEASDTRNTISEEQQAYKLERTTESYNYNVRRRYITDHASGLTRGTRDIRGTLKSDRRTVTWFMKFLKKKNKK